MSSTGHAVSSSGASHRLYVRAKHVSFQRGKRNSNPNISLLKLEGVDTTEAAKYDMQQTRIKQRHRLITRTASTSERRSCTSTEQRRRSGDPRSGASGARSEGHTVLLHGNIKIQDTTLTGVQGNNGAVRASFRNNLPPKTLGATLRVMLYPSSI